MIVREHFDRDFPPGMASLEQSIREAMESGSLNFAYQPIVALGSGAVVGAEALIRWRENGRVRAPDDFIPIIERHPLIVDLGHYTLLAACRQGALWRRSGHSVRISVNVAARQMADPDFPRRVREVLAVSEFEASLLELEITERDVLVDLQATVSVLRDLRAMGVSIALDDFGTGHNTFEALRFLEVDSIKIDQSYISAMTSSRRAHAMTAAIIAAAHALNTRVVAEGIESEAQRLLLANLGCNEGQGYNLGHAIDPIDFGVTHLRVSLGA